VRYGQLTAFCLLPTAYPQEPASTVTDHLPLFLLAVPAGLVSFLSPCVLPLVPPYLCFLTGATLEQLTDSDAPAATRPRALSAALSFVIGFSTVFITLGATASVLGSLLRQALSWTVTLGGHEFNVLASLAGLAIIAMGLHFIGAWRIALFDSELRYQHAGRPAGGFGAFMIGVAFAFGWTPCIGPVLATILAVAASEESVVRGAGLLALYSAGLGLPFIAAAYGLQTFIGAFRHLRRHLAKIEMIMGVTLVLTGIMFMTGAMQTFSYWLLETFPDLGKLG
jgi:cytochrome c-type biogenesis protein